MKPTQNPHDFCAETARMIYAQEGRKAEGAFPPGYTQEMDVLDRAKRLTAAIYGEGWESNHTLNQLREEFSGALPRPKPALKNLEAQLKSTMPCKDAEPGRYECYSPEGLKLWPLSFPTPPFAGRTFAHPKEPNTQMIIVDVNPKRMQMVVRRVEEANVCVSDGPADAPELTRSAEGPFAARNG